MKNIVVAFDHRGASLAKSIAEFLVRNGYNVCMGTSKVGDDYIDNAIPALQGVGGEFDYAILICGTGVGMAIVANRFDGIFAVHAKTPAEAHFARCHENANVLVLGAGYSDEKFSISMSETKAKSILKAFLSSEFEGGRHSRRIQKVEKINK